MAEQVHEGSFVRPLANFPASIWDDDYILSLENLVAKSYIQKMKLFKEIVKKTLSDLTIHAVEKICVIDELYQLGVWYHFETDIEDQLKHIWDNNLITGKDYDLYTTAVVFRVFREHGFRQSCDVFNKFKDNNGKLKEELRNDARGMLSLYEASYLSVRGEDFLDEAQEFAISSLKSLMSTESSPHLVEHIMTSLQSPTRTGLNRLKVRQYISFYENQETRNEMLLKFAKMDFNMVQMHHRNELCQLVRWWKETNLVNNLSHARNRIVEGFFWITGVVFEPKFSRARSYITKALMFITLLDDTFDAFGKPDELQVFTEAMKRFEASAISELPDYMKYLYTALLDFENDVKEDLKNEGRSFAFDYEKDAVIELVEAYHREAKWFHKGYVPTFDEYIATGMVTIASTRVVVSGLSGMEDVGGIEDFRWIKSRPKCVKAVEFIGRVCDDMKSIEHENERGHVASSLECYMKQHGVSMEEAVLALKRKIRDAWKDINAACLRPTATSATILTLLINCASTLEYVYKYRDSYTYSSCMKDDINLLLIDPIPVRDD